MTGIDLSLFDYDRHNSIYFFAMNADEQIYLRYGGRDSADATTYLDLNCIELALQSGLRQHELYNAGKLLKQIRPAAFFPQQIASLKTQIIERNRCVECHLIGDYLAQDLEKAGKLDKRKILYPSPDLKTLGILLDVPKGLTVERVEGAAQAAGMLAGDTIAGLDGTAVLTFGDLQYRLGQTDRDAKSISMQVMRSGAATTLQLALPPGWWYIDTTHRYWTVEPMLYFSTKALSAEKKRELGLDPNGFAAEVVEVDPLAESLKIHTLKPGDIVYEIGGLRRGTHTQRPELHIKLTVRAGDAVGVKLRRDGKPLDMEIKTYRQYFRKERTE